MDERRSVILIDALVRVWTKIRERHPQVPAVVILAVPAAHGSPNSLGHFAALRWRARKNASAVLHEVVVVAEHLDRRAADIAETLIHEAAHALNHARGVHDCSASQYHNRHFKTTAEELGLEVQQVKHYGFALTTLPLETAARYRVEIQGLEEVLIHRKKPLLSSVGGRTPRADDEEIPDEDDADLSDTAKPGRNRKAVCRCSPPYIIRVSKKTIDETTIVCTKCEQAFCLAA